MFVILPTYSDLFLREFEVRTTYVTKETYEHKTIRLIHEKLGKDADNAIALWRKESGLRFDAVNLVSGAAGIAQRYPRSALPCGLEAKDIECQIVDGAKYLKERYGSAQAALITWNMNALVNGEGSY